MFVEKSMNLFKECSSLINVRKGQNIIQLGDQINAFYYIQKGLVKIALDTLEGKAITISLSTTGEIFGYLDYLHNQTEYTRHAIALTDTTLYSIPIEKLDDPKVKEEIIFPSMLKRLNAANEMIFILSSMTVPERLRWLLKKLQNKKEESKIEFSLTHEEISNILGCSRQKVSSYLSKWKKDGAISIQEGNSIILNEEKMK